MKELIRRRLVLVASASSAALLLLGHVNAAPPAPAPAAFSWTGCYVGAHAGWGGSDNSITETEGSRIAPIVAGTTLESSGGLFGGQVSCDYEFAGNLVVGLQGDVSASGINGSGADPFSSPFFPLSIGVKTDWLASATGRFGIVGWDSQTMVYGKGGAAWAHDRWDLTNSLVNINSSTPLIVTETRTGWTVGAGIERALTPSWLAFAEFDLYQFGGGSGVAASNTIPTTNGYQTGLQNMKILKVGVDYKLFGQ